MSTRIEARLPEKYDKLMQISRLHVKRVHSAAVKIARSLQRTGNQVDLLAVELAALFHDLYAPCLLAWRSNATGKLRRYPRIPDTIPNMRKPLRVCGKISMPASSQNRLATAESRSHKQDWSAKYAKTCRTVKRSRGSRLSVARV